MDPFSSHLAPPFSPHDDPIFVDCVLYPTSDADLLCHDRETLLQQRVSKYEDSANGSYFPSSYPDAGPTSVYEGGIGIHNYNIDASNEQYPEQPFADKIANCFTESSTLKPPPTIAPGTSMHARASSSASGGYTHSDAFASPWTAHLSTPGLDSPSSSNLDHLNCYISSPASAYPTDLFIQPADQCMYPPPEGIADIGSVSLPQVQGMPDQQSVEDMQIDNQGLFPLLNDHDKIKTSSSPTMTLEDDFPHIKKELARSPKRSSPISTTAPSTHRKLSTSDRVQKPRATRSSTTAVHHQQRQSQASHHNNHNHHQTRKGSGSSSTSSPKNSSGRTRQFKCSFADYGCNSVFATKNEWKRHVSSQHLQLGFYRCDVDKCNIDHQTPNQHNRPHHKKSRSSHHPHNHTLSDDATSPTANDFNRKDLFTSHLRRMHAPWAGQGRANDSRSPSTKERESFDRSLDSIRERCWHQQREPPLHSQCGICGQQFRGERSWDDRMEHVGRHYEREEAQPEQEREDAFLREWAIEQNIIVPVEGGQWMLASLLS